MNHAAFKDFPNGLPGPLRIEPCPCGRCNKVVVKPIFFSATVDREVAEELVRRWNAFMPNVIDLTTVTDGEMLLVLMARARARTKNSTGV